MCSYLECTHLMKINLPGKCLTVDEQLVPFRGRCPFKQYIPSKPDKYGMKLFWVCDSATGYPLNAIPYLGKDQTGNRAIGIAHKIVRDLCQRYANTNRNVTMDNFFTSYELSQEMLGSGMTIVGTVRKNKKFIPQEFQANRSREIGSILFGFRPRITLMSHVPKQSKSVVLLSTMHTRPTISSSGKAEINEFYNSTKGGVDVLDQMCHTYSCQRKTNRWPFAFFKNLLNVSGVAAFILYNATHGINVQDGSFRRKRFLLELSDSLVYDQIMRRNTERLSATHISLISEVRQMLNVPEEIRPASSAIPAPVSVSKPQSDPIRKRCVVCPIALNRRIKSCCDNCDNYICGEH